MSVSPCYRSPAFGFDGPDFINLFVEAWLKLLGIKINFGDDAKSLNMDELRSIVTDAGKFLPNKHRSILLNLFELEKIKVDDVSTAHPQVEVINFDLPLDDSFDRIANSHHTRLPVREGENEEIFGILHLRKVMSLMRQHQHKDERTKTIYAR